MVPEEITVRERDGVTILGGNGRITVAGGTGKLANALAQLQQEGKMNVILNLADIKYIDSSALGQIMSGFEKFAKQGGGLKLLRLHGRVKGYLQTTKVTSLLDIFDDEEIAVKSFFKEASATSAPDI